jgi:hypothetical protein
VSTSNMPFETNKQYHVAFTCKHLAILDIGDMPTDSVIQLSCLCFVLCNISLSYVDINLHERRDQVPEDRFRLFAWLLPSGNHN